MILPRVIGLLKFLGDWWHIHRVIRWAEGVDEELKQNGQTRATAAAALLNAGPTPACFVSGWAKAWLERRGYQVLYRGQKALTPGADFLSSVANGTVCYNGATGIQASQQLETDIRAAGLCPRELAALYDSEMIPDTSGRADALHNEPIGAAGICFSEHLPVSAGYAQRAGERLYVTLQRLEDASAAFGFGYAWEDEMIALHRVPRSCILFSTAHRFPFCPPASGKQ